MALRTALRAALVAGVPALGGRVYESHAAGQDAPRPFAILRVGESDAGDVWGGASTLIEVWPYTDQTTFVTIDSLVASIVATLDDARVTDGSAQYLVAHEPTGGADFYDEDWRAITRPVRFRVFSLAFQAGVTYSPDPVAALNTWTEATWPAQVDTDPATWNPQNSAPGVYWRLPSATVERMAPWGAWLVGDFRAHVLAPAASARLTWTRRLVEGLALQRRLPLSDDSPLLFREIAGDSEADAFTTGQVRLSARFAILQPAVTPVPETLTEPAVTFLLPTLAD